MTLLDLPPAQPGMRIGLFGGSFNPAHEGHRLVALQCLKRLALDRIWIMVSPGNPLKDHTDLAPLEHRLSEAVKIMDDPRLVITAFEAQHRLAYTYETIRYLTETYPDARFVWIMGADSLQTFDRWEHWEEIANRVPMAVYARPGTTFRATHSVAATALGHARLPEDKAATLADAAPPAWVYLRGMMSNASSTAIRKSLARAASRV
ncbi:MAG TPA: nicotinate-nucleotide adenylyltransferase [Devosia sp.]|jgi:nicotinate-nucleotide adenylyltransferase|nr:nicotinate-nucleotide adenylyltransferase [Devosia sp.]